MSNLSKSVKEWILIFANRYDFSGSQGVTPRFQRIQKGKFPDLHHGLGEKLIHPTACSFIIPILGLTKIGTKMVQRHLLKNLCYCCRHQ